MDGKSIEPVVVTYTFGDILGVVIHGWRRLIRALILVELIWLTLIVGMSLSHGATLKQAFSWIPWKWLAAGGVGVVLLWLILCPLVAFARLRRAGLRGPHKLALVDRGIRLESPKSEALVYWSAIRRTVRTSTRFYLFMVNGGALIIPRRAFIDGNDFDVFTETTELSWKAGALIFRLDRAAAAPSVTVE